MAEINGDTNGDGQRDISDATYYLRWLFQGGADSVSEKAGDRIDILMLGGEEQPRWVGNCEANTDGTLDISDPICSLNYLFQGGPVPALWG